MTQSGHCRLDLISDPTTGAFIDFFANTGRRLCPRNRFWPRQQPLRCHHKFYYRGHCSTRFNYPSGSSMGFFIPTGSGGLPASYHMTFVAVPGAVLTYTLHCDCLHNVEDAGMRWAARRHRHFRRTAVQTCRKHSDHRITLRFASVLVYYFLARNDVYPLRAVLLSWRCLRGALRRVGGLGFGRCPQGGTRENLSRLQR